MRTQTRILIIGGTACGPKAAARARRCDPSARITLIEQRNNLSTATCGLPYYVSGVIKSEQALVARQPAYFRDVMDITALVTTRATAIYPKDHRVDIIDLTTKATTSLEYDKLALATGCNPIVPDWPGKDLAGIFTLSSIPDASAIRNWITTHGSREAVIVGAGLIGLEMAEAFAAHGIKTTILEAKDWVLPALLDADMAAHLEKYLRSKGVKVLCGQPVAGFEGDGDNHVKKVLTRGGAVEGTLVLLALGVRPDTRLARAAGLAIGSTGGIAVNQYLQTSDPDIYAGGDCVELVNLITGQKTLVPLGSTANKHGRIIGSNVTGGHETFKGVVGTAIAKVFDLKVGRTGLTEYQARQAGYDVEISLVPTFEHATYYPGAKEILIKLVAERSTGRLLGGQALGHGDIAKRIDVLATAITFGATADDLATTDLAYAPPFNSALDPLHNAANVIRNKQTGLGRSITPLEVKRKIDSDDNFVLLDVRSPAEWRAQRIAARQAKLIPLPELRQRLGELDPNKEIITFCRTSIRAYQAQRLLDGAGFKNVRFMDGSLEGWPYATAE